MDGYGFLWIATQNGLCRFDGSNLVTWRHDPLDSLTISDNIVNDITFDEQGNSWIASRGGMSRIKRNNGAVTRFLHDPLSGNSLAGNVLKTILADQEGSIWICPDANGLNKFNITTETFSHFLPSSQVKDLNVRFVNTLICLVQDPNKKNILWAGSQAGLLQFNKESGKWTSFPLLKSRALNPEMFSGKENVIRALHIEKSGIIWLGTWGGGLCRLDPESGNYTIFKYEALQPVNGFRNNISALCPHNENELWIGTEHMGLALFNKKTGTFRFLHDDLTGHLLVPNNSSLIFDRNGYLWVGTFSNGLYYTNLKAHQFNKIHMPFSFLPIAAGIKNPDNFYTGTIETPARLMVVDRKTGKYESFSYHPEKYTSENYFVRILEDKDRTWLLESHNLYYFDPLHKKISLYPEFQPSLFIKKNSDNVSAIHFLMSACISQSGEMWIGSKLNGIFRHDLKSKSTYCYYLPDSKANSIFFQNFVFSMFADSKDRIWYGMTDLGYFSYPGQKFVNLSLARDYPECGVKSAIIRDYVQTPDGHIWLGTENSGIIVIDPDKKPGFIDAYNSGKGLLGNLVKDMAVDSRSHVWVITDKSLAHIDPTAGSVECFGLACGLTTMRQMCIFPDDQVIITSDYGYYSFFTDSIQSFRNEVIPYIKSIRIFDQAVPIDNPFEFATDIRLDYDQNFFSIEYGSINYFNPEQTIYSYMLEGIEKGWVNAGSRDYVSYTNLRGGHYMFRLRVSNGGKEFREISIPLFIGTPYWKTWWFYSLILLFILVAIYLFFNYRMKQVRRHEEIKASYNKTINQLEMKALRAQMNPHFLFNSLNSIRYYILKEDMDNASEYITKFSKLLRMILRNSRQNQISLRDEVQTLTIYVDFEKMRFSDSFEYSIFIDESLNQDEIQIQPMTIQPFVENAIWHGLMAKEGSRKLDIGIRKERNFMIITVEDNGVGRKRSAESKSGQPLNETKSFGLKIMEERFTVLRNIRGKDSHFEIVDLYDPDHEPSGTKVIITYEI